MDIFVAAIAALGATMGVYSMQSYERSKLKEEKKRSKEFKLLKIIEEESYEIKALNKFKYLLYNKNSEITMEVEITKEKNTYVVLEKKKIKLKIEKNNNTQETKTIECNLTQKEVVRRLEEYIKEDSWKDKVKIEEILDNGIKYRIPFFESKSSILEQKIVDVNANIKKIKIDKISIKEKSIIEAKIQTITEVINNYNKLNQEINYEPEIEEMVNSLLDQLEDIEKRNKEDAIKKIKENIDFFKKIE